MDPSGLERPPESTWAARLGRSNPLERQKSLEEAARGLPRAILGCFVFDFGAEMVLETALSTNVARRAFRGCFFVALRVEKRFKRGMERNGRPSKNRRFMV